MLVAVLRSHGDASAAVAWGGCRAIANLSVDVTNQTSLGEAGICAGVSFGFARVVSEMAFGLCS